MSTAIEIDRMPASFSRFAIQDGVGEVASIPSTPTSKKFEQPAVPWIGALSATLRSKPETFSGVTSDAGSVNLALLACEYSLAIPRIEKQ